MKPTFLRVGVPKSVTRAPATVRPPTSPGSASRRDLVTTNMPVAAVNTLDLPTYQSGDLVVVLIHNDSNGAVTLSTPSGWTRQSPASNSDVAMYTRIMDGTEGTTLDVTPSANFDAYAIAFVHRGLDWSTFTIDHSGWASVFNAEQVNMSHGSITYDVYIAVMTNNNFGPSVTDEDGYTALVSDTGAGSWIRLYHKQLTGTTEDPDFTWNKGGGSSYIITIAIAAQDTSGEVAAGSHSHVEADISDLDHWTETDHDALDHTGLTGVGASDHGALTGLSDDDHTQYVLADGTRPLTSNWSAGSNKITNVTDPTSAQDAATKAYVDANSGGEYWEVVVSGSAPPVAVSTEDDDDWVYGLVP